MIEANDSQPPEMLTDPNCTTVAVSKKGLKMPTKNANGAAMSSLRPRKPKGRLPSAAVTTGYRTNGVIASRSYFPNETTHTMNTSVVTTLARGSSRCTGVSWYASWSSLPRS